MTPQDMRERAAQWLEKAHQGWSNSECVPLGAIAIWIRAIRAIPIPEPTRDEIDVLSEQLSAECEQNAKLRARVAELEAELVKAIGRAVHHATKRVEAEVSLDAELLARGWRRG